MENQKANFEYTYSSTQQEEIEKIRKKYLPKEEDKMEMLRKLDRDVTKPGTIWSILLGVLGCLVFGLGMCCVMVWGNTMFIPGIIIGILGMVVMGGAYPSYQYLTKRQTERLAPQILALTEELSK